jgi:hypothetical protein
MIINRSAASIFFLVCGSAIGQTSFWNNSTTPGTTATNDSASVNLGMKFYSDVPGSVTGIRFYKGYGNNGTHIGTLWSSSGASLASVTFSGESASGWQQANFSSPVNIIANTTYVVSYLAPQGRYPVNQYFSWSPVDSGPLHASGSSAGVYSYGSSTRFPISTYRSSNYWVDVVFRAESSPNPPPSPTTYSISGNVSGSSATLTLSGLASRTTTTNSSGNYSFSGLPNGSYVVAPSRAGYAFTPTTASATVNGSSVSGVNFTARVVTTPPSRSVVLSWQASPSSGIDGYNVYRANVSGGTYSKLNGSPVVSMTFVDSNVSAGRTYYYVTTAVDNGTESEYSNQATAVVP